MKIKKKDMGVAIAVASLKTDIANQNTQNLLKTVYRDPDFRIGLKHEGFNRCPVCKSISSVDVGKACEICGFNDYREEFINQQELRYWQTKVVKPYRDKYKIQKEPNKNKTN